MNPVFQSAPSAALPAKHSLTLNSSIPMARHIEVLPADLVLRALVRLSTLHWALQALRKVEGFSHGVIQLSSRVLDSHERPLEPLNFSSHGLLDESRLEI